jgi:hypothetical protein
VGQRVKHCGPTAATQWRRPTEQSSFGEIYILRKMKGKMENFRIEENKLKLTTVGDPPR